jgi:hypothetical protein
LYKIQQALDDRILNDILGVDKFRDILFLMENKIKEKDAKIKVMKQQLEQQFFEKNAKLIFVSDPYAINSELYNEIKMTHDIYNELKNLYRKEKEKNKFLEDRLKV